jgi:hypothetical protein
VLGSLVIIAMRPLRQTSTSGKLTDVRRNRGKFAGATPQEVALEAFFANISRNWLCSSEEKTCMTGSGLLSSTLLQSTLLL